MMLPLLVLLATLSILITISILIMKTNELSESVSRLTTATLGLSSSIDSAIAILLSQGASTPDADVAAAIIAIDTQSANLTTAKAKLDAALSSPST